MYLEEVYAGLVDEGKITNISQGTNPYWSFNQNISGALLLPTLKYGPESDDDQGLLNLLMIHELANTQIITSMETYYRDIFMTITAHVMVSEIEPKALSLFVKRNRLMTEFIDSIGDHNCFDFKLSEIIPEYFPLQHKDKIKSAMQLLGLNPVLREDEWSRTFGDHNQSTVNQRHAFIHTGIGLNNIPRIVNSSSAILSRIKDAIVIVNSLESQICSKYPESRIAMLYPEKWEPKNK